MQRRTRRIIFYSLIGVFVVAGPLLVAHAVGYRMDLKTLAVEKTGGIFIKSKTPRLSVFLDGAFMKETSFISGSTLLTEINPHPHLIRLEKQNHHPWFKTVRVEPTKVVELRHIILVPKPVPIATSTAFSPGAPNDPSFGALLLALAPQTPKSLQTPAPKLPPPFRLDKDHTLVAAAAGNIRPLASHVHSIASFDDALFFVDKNGFFARLDLITEEVLTLGRPGFYLDQGPLQFAKTPAGELTILDPSGGLFILDSANTLVAAASGVNAVHFDLEGEKIALAKTQSVEVLWRKDNPQQPFQRKGDHEIIMHTDTKIRDVRWFLGDNAHLLIRTNEGIFFTELDGRGGRNTVELVSGPTDELITTPKLPHTVLFKKRKEMYQIEL